VAVSNPADSTYAALSALSAYPPLVDLSGPGTSWTMPYEYSSRACYYSADSLVLETPEVRARFTADRPFEAAPAKYVQFVIYGLLLDPIGR
jgi:hypothetical protein